MTSVAEQLRRLALPQTKLAKVDDKKRPSLLFDSGRAATFDRDSYYALGQNGYQELQILNPGLWDEFYDDLFSEKAKDTERAVQSKDFNKNLDEKISGFLTVVSPYLNLRCALKCIEWLVYRFHIPTFNVSAVMKCVLPYYSTNIFVRVVQMLEVREPTNQWHWLSAFQKDGVSLSTQNIISHCQRDKTFLQFICSMTDDAVQLQRKMESGESKWSMNVHVNFFTSTVLGLLDSVTSVKENVLRQLLPTLLKGMESSFVDLHASCLMIVSQLAVKSTLNKPVIHNLLELLVRRCAGKLEVELVKLIILVCQTQEQVGLLPRSVLNFLFSSEQFVEVFSTLNENGRINNFLEILYKCLVDAIFAKGGYKNSLEEREVWAGRLKTLLGSLALSEALQVSVVKDMIESYVESSAEEQTAMKEMISPVFDVMRQKYPSTFDSTISPYFHQDEDDSPALSDLFMMSLTNLKHQSLPDHDLSLQLALLHDDPAIQCRALKHMTSSLTSSLARDPATAQFAVDNVVSLLNVTKDASVVREALTVMEKYEDMFSHKADLICERLVKLVLVKSDERGWEKVMKKTILFLTSERFSGSRDVGDHVMSGIPDLTTFTLLHFLLHVGLKKSEFKSNLINSYFVKNSDIVKKLLSQQPGIRHERLVEYAIAAVADDKPDVTSYTRLLHAASTTCGAMEQPVCSPALHAILAAGLRTGAPHVAVEEVTTMVGDAVARAGASPDPGCLQVDAGDVIARCVMARDEVECDVNLSVLLRLLLESVEVKFEAALERKMFLFVLAMMQCVRRDVTERNRVTSALLDVVMTQFLRHHFPRAHQVVAFAQLVWCDVGDDVMHVTYLRQASAGGCRQQILHLLRALLLSASEQSKMTMPARCTRNMMSLFLLSTTDSHRDIRVASIEGFATFAQVFPGSVLTKLAVHLQTQSEEIVADGSHISTVLHQYFDETDAIKKQRKTELQDRKKILSSLVRGNLSDDFNINFITTVFSQTQHPALLETLLDEGVQRLVESPTNQKSRSVLKFAVSKVTSHSLQTDRVESFFVECLKMGEVDHQVASDAFGQINKDFYMKLAAERKQKLLKIMLDVTSTSTVTSLLKTIAKTFKAIWLDSAHLSEELKSSTPCFKKPATTTPHPAGAKPTSPHQAVSMEVTGDDDVITASEDENQMKRLIPLLEMLQHKKRIRNSQNLITPLFDLLEKLMEVAEWCHEFEYSSQLVLGCLLNVVAKLNSGKFDRSGWLEVQDSIRVEQLVRCVQMCESVQTCQQGLLLIASTASICPEKVLHTVISVFTFMGTSLLKRDDSFSLQIITRAINTILPTLFKQKQLAAGTNDGPVVAVLRVFVDAFPHIPPHRRCAVFDELLNTVGAEEYLAQVLILMVDQFVCLRGKPQDEVMDVDQSQSFLPTTLEGVVEVWASISSLFPVHTQLSALTRAIKFAESLPLSDEKDEAKRRRQKLIDASKRSDLQLRRHRLITLAFASHLLSTAISRCFRDLDATAGGAADADVMREFETLLECVLTYIDNTSREKDVYDDTISVRYYKALTHRLDDLLKKANALLPTSTFLQVVTSLMSEGNSLFVVNRSIHLFNDRIPAISSQLDDDQMASVAGLTERLFQVFAECSELASAKSNDDVAEPLLHSVALAIKQVFRICPLHLTSRFASFLPTLCDILSSATTHLAVVAPALACMGEVCSAVKAYSLPHLYKVAPCLIQLLDKESRFSEELVVRNSTLQAAHKLFTSAKTFVSPHLAGFLSQLTQLAGEPHLKLQAPTNNKKPEVKRVDGKRVEGRRKREELQEQITSRISQLLHFIAINIPARVLVPNFTKCLDQVEERHPLAVSPLAQVVKFHIGGITKDEVWQFSTDLFSLLLRCLDFRSAHSQMELTDVEYVEDHTTDCVVTLLLKQPEATFRPLFMKLHEWAKEGEVPRANTFYKIALHLVEKLKILFAPFAAGIIQHLTLTLQRGVTSSSSPVTSSQGSERVEAETLARLRLAVDTLRLSLLHCGKNLMEKEKVDSITEPLVNQLDVMTSGGDDYVTDHVIPCVAEAVMTSGSDVTWQPIHYQVLLKTRHNSAKVRIRALHTIQAIVEKLGEDYMVVLPETVPFFAELMEDEEDEVEKHCHLVIQRLEKILGEPLQKYF